MPIAPINRRRRRTSRRQGKVLVLLCIMLPTMLGIVGLVYDGGLMADGRRELQHAADAAALAAAHDLMTGKSTAIAVQSAEQLITASNGISGAIIKVNIPPTSGSFAGQAKHVEVIIRQSYASFLMHIVDGGTQRNLQARAVAGVADATRGAAIVVLDPNPAPLTLAGIDTLLSGISVGAITSAAIPQTGVTQLVAGLPLIGPTVANLLNTSLNNLLPSTVSQILSNVGSQVSILPLPTLIASLEVEGLGRLLVDGAILNNSTWGGLDENRNAAGKFAAPPYGMACMPLLPTTRVRASDILMTGGVDRVDSYQPFVASEPKPLQANRAPVDDPYIDLPVPSLASDPTNVVSTIRTPGHAVRVALAPAVANSLVGGVFGTLSALLKPLLAPLLNDLEQLLATPQLTPGVYDSITVLSPLGGAHFAPGVYIIRSKSPITQMSLVIVGPVEAKGVCFYITDSASYSASTGQPDAGDNLQATPPNPLPSLLPSTLIAPLLPAGHLTGLADPTSPFNGLLIYQHRSDRRPIILEAQQLIGNGDISGTIYGKWAHTTFVAGAGSYDLKFVTGTLRVVTVTDTLLAPTTLLPAAKDIFLLE